LFCYFSGDLQNELDFFRGDNEVRSQPDAFFTAADNEQLFFNQLASEHIPGRTILQVKGAHQAPSSGIAQNAGEFIL
jgi:hypothetical protein